MYIRNALLGIRDLPPIVTNINLDLALDFPVAIFTPSGTATVSVFYLPFP